MLCIKLITVLICLFFQEAVLAQHSKTDSLLALLPAAKDTSRVNVLNQVSATYCYIDPKARAILKG